MIRILLVDDQNIVRQGIQALLESRPKLKVVGTAEDGNSAIEQVENLRPDVVLIDIEMPAMSGIAATDIICQQFPQTKVIVLSSHENQKYVAQALQAGAEGYLLKNILAEDLEQAIWSVYRGRSQIESRLLREVLTGQLISQSIKSIEKSESTVVRKQSGQKTLHKLYSNTNNVFDTNNKHLKKIEGDIENSQKRSLSKTRNTSLETVFERFKFDPKKLLDRSRRTLSIKKLPNEQVSEKPIAKPPHQKWWVMLGIGLSVLMTSLNSSIVNIALPTLVKTFDTDFATIQLVVLSYLLVMNTLVLGAGRLGDLLGKKRLYLMGLVLLTISSILCGLSPSVYFLIGFRSLQGLGAVFISALGVAIITQVFPDFQRGRALGIISAITSLGVVLGPSIGGLLISLFGWRTIFLANVPIGIFAYFIVFKFVPAFPVAQTRQQFDWLGGIAVMATLSCFALGMIKGQNQGFGSVVSLTLLITAAIGLLCFLAIEARMKEPMLDLQIFRNLQLSLNLLVGFLVFIVLAGIIFVLPFFLELVLNYPTRQVGLMLAVPPILGGTIAPISGSLSDRFGTRIISVIGLALMVCGCLLISTFDIQLTNLGYILRIAPFAIGFGMFQSPNNSAILGRAPREQLGIVSGLLSLSRTLGQTTGVPLLGSLFTTSTLKSTDLTLNTQVTVAPVKALVFGTQSTFHAAALILVVAILLSAIVGWMEHYADN
jgi:EmrB/QacA subfamily drug resistance transporter